jgi:hypothetical protein
MYKKDMQYLADKIVTQLNHNRCMKTKGHNLTRTQPKEKVEESNLLVEDRLGLTTISRLFAVITALTLS